MNDCKFTGRFAKAPRRHDTDTTSRCYFTLMVNKEGKNAAGEKFPAQPVDFVAWGATADLICKYKDKGHLVLVTSEFSTYDAQPVDMDNKPIENARKYNRPIFKVNKIEFMPVNNGSSNYNNQQANNFNPEMEADFNALNSSNMSLEPSEGNIGDMPFEAINAGDDIFGLSELP